MITGGISFMVCYWLTLVLLALIVVFSSIWAFAPPATYRAKLVQPWILGTGAFVLIGMFVGIWLPLFIPGVY